MEIKSEVILDSLIENTRVTCLRVTYPRIVHAEFMRHRCGSYCSASSRAIPLDRMISQFGGFIPDKWRLHQSGMQPNEAHEFSKEQLDEIEILYEELRLKSINTATRLHQIGVSKEQVNRLIEPYSYITHLVQMTSAGFKSFFDLRLPTTAQYEIRGIAKAMWASLEDSVPEQRKCHIPFYNGDYTNLEVSMKASSARCARTSFYNHEGKEPSLEEDLSLATRLLTDKHMSPFEFPVLSFGMANAMFGDIIGLEEYYSGTNYSVLKPKNLSGNLGSPDLVQYRKLLEQPRIE
jgi:thymidylate synthase ThyX